jgi:3-oxoacyl-[acyl-carrier protein] reductase
MCGLTRSVALESARHGITCTAVQPGWIATGSATAREIAAGRKSPAGRPGTPDEAAACCRFLAGEGASCVNGAMLVGAGRIRSRR